METVGDRLKIWRSYLGTTQPAFSELIGIHVGMLKKYETGKTVPGGETLASIATTGVNLHWLLTGEGHRKVISEGESISDLITVRERQSPPLPPQEAPSIDAQLAELALVLKDIPRLYADRLIDEFFSRALDSRRIDELGRALAELREALSQLQATQESKNGN